MLIANNDNNNNIKHTKIIISKIEFFAVTKFEGDEKKRNFNRMGFRHKLWRTIGQEKISRQMISQR